jgi:mono/diheme cytochrome c family protein
MSQLVLCLLVAGAAGPPAVGPSRFETEILPLFQAKCTRCHGPKTRRADLDLSSLAGALKGGESGPAVVPGSPEKSPLFEKVHSGAMPPAKKDRLRDAEVEAIRRWIAAASQTEKADRLSPVTQHDVLPILLRRCGACHGARHREAGLDLRTRAAMLKGGKSGPAIAPGKPGESLLVRKVREGAMPPRHRLVEASVKPIEPTEVETVVRWIAAGAPEVAVVPDVATTTPDPLVTDRDRDFWAFRPPQTVEVPPVTAISRVRNPIDAFILRKLEEKGLTLSPEADGATLLRRAHFDLTGLPPEPADVEAFLADRSPGAYDRLLDRLLASPRYGERWGRYWLDLAGYADSEGKREQDLPRPHAWRYRDYVVRAFNADKPYGRFLLEQLAGDELADGESKRYIPSEIYDNLVATGFLRMAPDPTWANITGYVEERLEVIADEVDVLGSGVLGLTLKCARCHGHKFDPIPHRDYYRLLAVFKGAFDEYDWLKPEVRPGIGPVSQDVQKLGPRVLRGQIHALWDRGEPSPTYVYRRGDANSPGQLVGPGVPSVLTDGKTPFVVTPPWPGAKKTGRRLAFARWLVRPEHPLTARVIVNRLWKHHFGSGIVKTLGNFGKAGAPPSHPELLDWLAREFARGGMSLKAMHRLMMTSAAYRQRSQVTLAHERLDPENVLVSRMRLVRLDAEALYDTMLLVAGELDEARGGPADGVQARPDGLVTPARSSRGWRRLVYVAQRRKQLPTHLESFDFPQMNPNCLERRGSTVAPQALHLLNNGMVRQLAEAFARRVRREAGEEPGRQVERAYLIAMSRPPSAEEREVGVAALGRMPLTSYCHTLLNTAGFLYVD